MHARQKGFTYLGMLLAIALLGLGLASAAEVWSRVAERQRLEQLDWAGRQIQAGIASYYESSPIGRKRYPPDLNALLEDRRAATVRRHLRVAYRNPLTASGEWTLLRAADGGVRGVAVVLPAGHLREGEELIFEYAPLR